MKSNILAVSLGLGLLVPMAALADGPPSVISGNKPINVYDTSSVSFTAVAAPGVGARLRVLGLALNSKTTDQFTVKCGSTVKKGPYSLGDNGGVVRLYRDVDFLCGENEALVIDKGVAATNVLVEGEYRVETP